MTRSRAIFITNSANIIVGETGPDTLENLVAVVADWEPCEGIDGELVNCSVALTYSGYVTVTIPAHYEDGWLRRHEVTERVGYVIGSAADPNAE